MKISEAFAKYQRNEVLAMNYSQNTLRAYENTARSFIKYFGDCNIKRLNLDSINDYYLNLIKTTSKNTARHYLSNLKAVLKFCRRRGIKTVDPDEIRLPRSEKKAAHFINEKQYKIFLAAVDKPIRGYNSKNRMRNVLIVKMLYETGLRISELCALNRDSIRDRQFVVIGKSKEPRVCFITEELEAMINNYLDTRDDDNEALFISDLYKERLTTHNVQEIFRRLSKRSGIGHVTPHTLRHSYATRFLEKGVDIRIISTLLGHQNVATTQTYTHVTNCLLKQTYDLTFA